MLVSELGTAQDSSRSTMLWLSCCIGIAVAIVVANKEYCNDPMAPVVFWARDPLAYSNALATAPLA